MGDYCFAIIMHTLKDSPGALLNWLHSEYPHISPTHVSFIEGGNIDQTRLNPYENQVMILYRRDFAKQRIYLFGCIIYGSDDVVDLKILSTVQVLPMGKIYIDPTPDREDVTMDEIKAHINGTYFSFETLQLILKIAPFAKSGVLSTFLKREMKRDLTPHLPRFVPFLELLDPEFVTLADYQRAHGGSASLLIRPFPNFFNIPIDEYVPGTNHPLYVGGFFHISEYEMNPWIWRHLTRNCAVRNAAQIHPEQAQHLLGCMNDLKKRREHIPLVAKEDVEKHLAPCMHQILYGKKFPKDLERQQVVRVLSAANVPLSYIEERLGALNVLDPHDQGRMELRKRWDYKAHYKAKYASPRCESMILSCPLAPGKDIAAKKSVCYLMYPKKFLEKPVPNPKTFYGPIKWFEW